MRSLELSKGSEKMKDKINKTHHKRGYYTMRRFSVLSILVFSGVASFAVPTYISLQNSEMEKLKAQEKTEEENPSSTSEEQYLTYEQ